MRIKNFSWHKKFFMAQKLIFVLIDQVVRVRINFRFSFYKIFLPLTEFQRFAYIALAINKPKRLESKFPKMYKH